MTNEEIYRLIETVEEPWSDKAKEVQDKLRTELFARNFEDEDLLVVFSQFRFKFFPISPLSLL